MNTTTATILVTLTGALATLTGVTPPHWAPRQWHRLYARSHGHSWLPCPHCGQHTGAHEQHDHEETEKEQP